MNKDINERMSLRTVFNQVALDYDEVRPGYPEELIKEKGCPSTYIVTEIPPACLNEIASSFRSSQ